MEKKESLAGKRGEAPLFYAANFRLQNHRAVYDGL